ncbi:uncharacterized protein LOC110858989 isoform X2 [Folsomia candida]|uniref:Uncharacterized protein n=1 Tax=Folsomia candida TaxID=158441 RepID=A0A226DG08_FOLCA|nr:uncharacterized protein LOC110858989 isoform X2 [Folsomia candida]OXA43136.1 hypothetical protein Fcan01_21964 [Folsomia candida]
MLQKLVGISLLPCLVLGQVFPGGPFPGGIQSCYNTPSNGQPYGECLQDDCCEGGVAISNLCPNYANNIRCCFSRNRCTTGCGACYDVEAKDYACRILAMHERGEIRLKSDHFSADGNNPYDGASALSNVRDTCYGRQVKRSNYCAAAPGGCVCLKGSMLRAMHTYAVNFRAQYGQSIDINAIAGSCHSSTSWHYQGNTWDISCSTPRNHCTALRDFCLAQNIVEACYPGSSCGGHETWVHCAFA